MDKHYDPAKAFETQEAYCEAHKLPCFAPLNGICEHCGRNIFTPASHHYGTNCTVTLSGFSIEDAGEQLITRCPHCNHSFVG